MQQHGSLAWSIGGQSQTSIAALDNPPAHRTIAFPAPARRSYAGPISALAASILIATGLFFAARRPAANPASGAFATLIESKNAQWGPGQLPTEVGSRLSKGRLRLTEGFATILYDNGVRLVVESPADLDLLSPMNCLLHGGVLVAKVSPQAKGFSVQTPTANLVDYGTEFGVTANARGETQVQVFEGIVDVERVGSGKTQRLTKGKDFRTSAVKSNVSDVQNFEAQRPDATAQIENSPGTITLTTAFGRGKDAYIQTEPRYEHGSDVLLLVKNAQTDSFRRKAYVTFDLAGVPVSKIASAKLVLTMAPSGYGYASFTPECHFTVYGLTDESLDGWREESINWDNAPANIHNGAALDTSKATRVASFSVAEGVSSGEFVLDADDLRQFVRADHNGLVTFIIVRETSETRSGSLVHGFISRRNPTGAPPTLRLTLQN
jgi:hypothetical protein